MVWGAADCRAGWLRIATGLTTVDEEQDRENVAAELARVRDEARARMHAERTAMATEPPPPPALGATAAPGEPGRPPVAAGPTAEPAAPSARAVNELWRAEPPAGTSRAALVIERLLRARLSAQRDWNAAQVRLDNEILRWVEERFASTHAHYDALLGALGRRLDDVDERHRRLEKELVAHVRELVRRTDLAAAEASRGRASLELQLDDLRARLERLERALDRQP
jgi:hypothetical protein